MFVRTWVAVAQAQERAKEAVRLSEGGMEVIDGLVKMFPELKTDPDARLPDPQSFGDPPRGQDAVRQVMEGVPGRWWTVTGLVNEMEARGWPAAPNAVRQAADRLVNSDPTLYHRGTGEKTGSTTYSFRPFDRHPPVDVDMVTLLGSGPHPEDQELQGVDEPPE